MYQLPRLSASPPADRSSMSEPDGQYRAKRQHSRAAWLVYGVVGIFAAVLCSQYLLHVPSIQPSTADHHPRSQADSPTGQWQRISLRTEDDLDKSLPVLLDFIEHPAHALPLTELTLDIDLIQYCGDDDNPLVIDLEAASPQEQKIKGAVKAIELESKLEKELLEALFWKVRGLKDPEAENGGFSRQASKARSIQRNRRVQYARAAAVLFCSLSPNLSTLRTVEPHGTLSEFFLAINSRWASQQTGLPLGKLAQVYLIDRSKWGILNDKRFYRYSGPLDFIQHFHRFPSLAAFDAYTIANGHAEIDLLPPGLSSLKSISVRRSDLSSQAMGVLIRLATALDDVHFSIGGRAANHGGMSLIYPKGVGKALEAQQTTLRRIDLDLDAFLFDRAQFRGQDLEEEDFSDADPSDADYEHFQDSLTYYREQPHWKADEDSSRAAGYPLLTRDLPDTKPYGNTIGSFAAFEKLESLKIGIRLLLGPYNGRGQPKEPPVELVDMFPPTLKHLTIRGYKKGRLELHDRHVARFREQLAHKLPSLVSVEGLDEELPSGQTIRSPDAKDAPLYVEPAVEDGWLESRSTD